MCGNFDILRVIVGTVKKGQNDQTATNQFKSTQWLSPAGTSRPISETIGGHVNSGAGVNRHGAASGAFSSCIARMAIGVCGLCCPAD